MFTSAAVANYLLDKARAEGIALTHMKLQKLVYIAHGWHLAITGKSLLSDYVEAWQYGPVIPKLYQRLKHYGHNPIAERVREINPQTGEMEVPEVTFPEPTRAVLDRVWDAYKGFSAVELSSLTHQPGTPWYAATVGLQAGEIKNRTITLTDPEVRGHYLTLAKKGK